MDIEAAISNTIKDSKKTRDVELLNSNASAARNSGRRSSITPFDDRTSTSQNLANALGNLIIGTPKTGDELKSIGSRTSDNPLNMEEKAPTSAWLDETFAEPSNSPLTRTFTRRQMVDTVYRKEKEHQKKRKRKKKMKDLLRSATRITPKIGADVKEAEKYREKVLLHRKSRGGEVELYGLDVDLQELPVVGGLKAYYGTLLFLSKVFLVMFFLSIPNAVTFGLGDEYGKEAATGLDVITMGNMGSKHANSTDIQGMGRNDISIYVSALDIAGILFLWLMIEYLQSSLNSEMETDKENNLSVKSFTVEVTNLPEDEHFTRQDLQQFFQSFTKYGDVLDVCILYNNTEFITKHVHLKELIDIREVPLNRNGVGICEGYLIWASLAAGKLRGENIKGYDPRIKGLPNEIEAFKGKVLKVRDAPEPSNMNYEFLDYTDVELSMRRVFSVICWGIFFAIALAIILGILEFQRSMPDQESCDTEYSESYIKSGNATSSEIDCYCYELKYQDLVSKESDTCEDYLQQKSLLGGLLIVSAFVSSCVSVGMGYVAPQLASFEQHRSKSWKERSIMVRLFIGYYVISGILLTIVNLDLMGLAGFPIWFAGKYKEFDPDWYASIGFTITAGLFMQIASVGCFPLLDMLYLSCRRAAGRCNISRLTQTELNDIYEARDIDLGTKYAYILSTVFTALTYSIGIPFMYLVVSLSFGITYLVERYALLRHYRYPPVYDLVVSNRAISYLKNACVFHLAVSYLILSTRTYMDSYTLDASSSGTDNISIFTGVGYWNTFLMFLPMLLGLVIGVLSLLYRYFPMCSTECLSSLNMVQRMPEKNFDLLKAIRKIRSPFETYHPSNRFDYKKAYQDFKGGLKAEKPLYMNLLKKMKTEKKEAKRRSSKLKPSAVPVQVVKDPRAPMSPNAAAVVNEPLI
eukprot:jgi/Bigna1/90500/estExt_fgenesh1_pg.C_720020